MKLFPEWIDAQARRTILTLTVSGAALFLSFAVDAGARPFDPAWVAVVLCGAPILLEAGEGLLTRFDIKADVLVSMALVASVAIGEIFAAGEIAWIMTIGALLEDLTVGKARSGIEALVRYAPETACRVTPAGEERIEADEIAAGDTLRIRPGERIPADGVVLSGSTSIDESVMTGESMPVDKMPGDAVLSGTLNRFGAFDMRAEKVGADSSVKRLIRLVESADANRAAIVRLADRWATWVVLAAVTAAMLTWFVTGEIVRSVTILVVFCPCALVLATPTAIVAAIGNATRSGFLVRAGDALERLAGVTKAAFDKTGTLTEGKPEVAEVFAAEDSPKSREEVYRLAAAAESPSEHPLGRAIAESWRKAHPDGNLPAAKNFEMIPGRGIRTRIDERTVLVGSRTFMEGEGIRLSEDLLAAARNATREGETISFVAAEGAALGFIALADRLREAAPAVIRKLDALHVGTLLLTGDRKEAGEHAARTLGIKEVESECLPEKKLARMAEASSRGEKIAMVGDGINDAPALKRAYVGIAMGGIGSDAAVEAADIVAVSDRIDEIPHLFRLSRRMMLVIKINLTIAMTVNFIAIVLAIGGWMGPVVGALVHNAGSVLVILHSASLLRWKEGAA